MNLNKKNMRQIMVLIIFAAIMLWLVFNYGIFISLIKFSVKLLMPVIVGICIAFILNVPMKLIETKVFKIEKRKHKKIIRTISLILSMILIFGIIGLIMFLIIPEFIEAVSTIGKNLPKNTEWLNKIGDDLVKIYPGFEEYLKELDLKSIINISIGSSKVIVTMLINFLSSFISRLVIFCIGFIIAIYILFDKENLSRQAKKIMTAFLDDKVTNKIIRVFELANSTFTSFLTGQCLDAALFGIIFFVCMTILKLPYALIISVLLSVTALIPYIGAFITLVVGAILIAVTSPIKALWYVILFLVLQQVEGNFMYPKIVGKSVGLPALWALVAALIGGSIFGFIGMIISIPISSILYSILKDYVNERLEEKNNLTSK